MSLENDNDNSERTSRREFLKGAAAGGALVGSVLGGRMVTNEVANEREMKEHVLNGQVIDELRDGGATDAEIAEFEATLTGIVIRKMDELARRSKRGHA